MNKIIGLLFSLLAVSCATNNMQTNSNTLQGKWELTTLDGKDVASTQPVILDFDANNNVSGNAGCNQLNGTYMVNNGTQISFDKLATTRMMCEAKQMQLETDVLEMLETANNFIIHDDVLSLNIGKRAPLATFHRMSDSGVVGRYWKLIELDGKDVSMAKNQEQEQFFIMKSDGTLRGFAGCNNFNGTYELNSDNMQIEFDKNMAMTMKSCPDVDIDEQALMEVFGLANNYTVSDNKLYLNIGRRAPLAVFEAVTF